MAVLNCLAWILSNGSIVTTIFLLMFSFGLFFKILRG